MEPKYGTDQLDSTLVKIALNTVKEGDLQAIINCLNKYNFDAKLIKDQQYDQNAFFFAALIKDDTSALNVMKYLRDLGVDATATDKLHQTCLYYAAREGKSECCEFLVEECKLPLNEKDIYGQTPIYYASREGRFDVVQLFVNNGADVNVEDKYAQNCLFYAVREGHIEIVKYLIEKGIDYNKVDKKGMTPHSFSEKFGKIKIAELLESMGAVTKVDKKAVKKQKQTKKTTESENKSEEVENIQKPRKCILIKILDNGEKVPLTSEEIESFRAQYKEAAELLFNPEALQKEVNEHEELYQYDSWEKQAKKLMNTLWKFKESEIFHRPVDPIELGIPDYFDIIQRPMDFGTIKKKLNNYLYTNCKEFVDDMELVFTNCIIYNGERSVVGNMCINVRNEFRRLYDSLNMNIFI